jgi:hypothetical protein
MKKSSSHPAASRPIVNSPKRVPFPDISALAKKFKPYKGAETSGFMADWRAQNERF